MPSIMRRKWARKISYVCKVGRKGFKTVVKSFRTKSEAKKWARAMECKLDTGDFSDYSEASKLTLGDLLELFNICFISLNVPVDWRDRCD